jgi:hypothetical protein
MDRTARPLSCRWVGLVTCLLGLAASSGCMPAITAAAYLIKGHNVDADYDGLKGKHVAVVVRPPITMNQDQALAAQEMAERITYLLDSNVRKISVIDQQEVANWTDEHNWESFKEIGKALEADMVVGVELDDFSLYRSSSVYQGRATVKIAVYDMQQDGKITFERELGQFEWPKSGAPVSNTPRADFRRYFVEVLSERIATHFYDHDGTLEFVTESPSISLH